MRQAPARLSRPSLRGYCYDSCVHVAGRRSEVQDGRALVSTPTDTEHLGSLGNAAAGQRRHSNYVRPGSVNKDGTRSWQRMSTWYSQGCPGAWRGGDGDGKVWRSWVLLALSSSHACAWLLSREKSGHPWLPGSALQCSMSAESPLEVAPGSTPPLQLPRCCQHLNLLPSLCTNNSCRLCLSMLPYFLV